MKNLFEEESQYMLPVYRRLPLEIVKGKDVYLYDRQGRCYLDLLSGIAVNSLGYQHPRVMQAIEKQLHMNMHLSNYFVQDVQVQLARKLVELSGLSRVFFTNSGTEAIEGILKLIRKWATQNNKKTVYSLTGSFHGRSTGALALTAQEKYQANFRPLISNIAHLPLNDTHGLDTHVNEETAAVFFEPVMGEGGIRAMEAGWVSRLLELRKKYGFLIAVDEIQSGIGRTGRFFAFEDYNFKPDLVATSKALGGGLPLGAFIVSENLVHVFSAGEHGTTFGGNPLACAAGLATVEIISDPDFLLGVQRLSNMFVSMLYDLREEYDDVIVDIRGKGLMLGLELRDKAEEVKNHALQNGLIINLTAGNTIRFVPPLTITKEHIDEAYEKLRTVFRQVFRSNS